MLDPAPLDFTRAADLDRQRVLSALMNGRPGTAMKPFLDILEDEEVNDVADFILDQFAACGHRNTSYHTEANGWPDHEGRHAAAFPFARGEIAIDAPEEMLDQDQLAGLATFRAACISCHEGRLSHRAPLELVRSDSVAETEVAWTSKEVITRRDDEGVPTASADPEEHGEYGIPTIHDVPPKLADLSATEAEGEELYQRICSPCHAADGTGKSWIGRFLDPGPADLTSGEFAATFDEAHFAARTLDPLPGGTMPSFRSVMSESDARAIAAYVARAFATRGD